MTMMRIIAIVLGLIAVALVAAVVFASSSFDGAREGGERSARARLLARRRPRLPTQFPLPRRSRRPTSRAT